MANKRDVELSKLDLHPGQILVVKTPAGIDRQEQYALITELNQALRQRGMDNLILLVDRSDFEVRIMSEAVMNEHGWFKVEKVAEVEVVEEEPEPVPEDHDVAG